MEEEFEAYEAKDALVVLLDGGSDTMLTFRSLDGDPAHIVFPTNKIVGLTTALLSAAEDAELTQPGDAPMPYLAARSCNVVRLPIDTAGLFLSFRIGRLTLNIRVTPDVAKKLNSSLNQHLTDE